MEKTLFYFLAVFLAVQLVNYYAGNYTEYLVIGIFTSSAFWYCYCFLIRPLNIQRVMNGIIIHHTNTHAFIYYILHESKKSVSCINYKQSIFYKLFMLTCTYFFDII